MTAQKNNSAYNTPVTATIKNVSVVSAFTVVKLLTRPTTYSAAYNNTAKRIIALNI